MAANWSEKNLRSKLLEALLYLTFSLFVPWHTMAAASAFDNWQQRSVLGRGNLLTLAVSPSGERLAVSTSLGVDIWNTSTWELEKHLAHTSWPYVLAWSPPDSRMIVSASFDRVLRIWDVQAGTMVREIYTQHTDEILCVAWSLDGHWIASGSKDKGIRIWDAHTGAFQRNMTGHRDAVTCLSWSPDSTRLASGSLDKSVRIWNARTGERLKDMPGGYDQYGHQIGHLGSVWAVAWSPDGRWIASGSSDKTIRIWTPRGETDKTLGWHAAAIVSLSWSLDSVHLASGSVDTRVMIWNTRNRPHTIGDFRGHADEVSSVSWWPGRDRVVSCSLDRRVQVWDVPTGAILKTLTEYTFPALSMAWSPETGRIASGYEPGTIQIWSADTGAVLKTLTGNRNGTWAVAWSPDGRKLVSGSADKTVRVWDVDTGVATTLGEHADGAPAVAWSPDGRKIVSGSKDRVIKVWDAQGFALLGTLTGHADWVRSVAWSPDSHKMASGSKDTTIKIWDEQTGTLLGTLIGHAADVLSLAWSPDGRKIASGSGDKIIKIWDAETGALLRNLGGHTTGVWSLAWSPDGTKMVSGSAWPENSIKIWDAPTGVVLATLTGHSSDVLSVAWSQNGRQIASCSWDGSIRLWGSASLPAHTYLLPQVANGQSGLLTVKTTFILTNPSNNSATADITLTGDDGSPFTVRTTDGVAGSTFRMALAPGSTQILQTDGSGTLAAGAAVINANAPIGVSATFSIFSGGRIVSEAGVLDAAGLYNFIIPVDHTDGSRIGMALFNSNAYDAEITYHLFDAAGQVIDNLARTLHAKAHESKFVDDLFRGISAGFTGAVSVSSTTPISAVALKLTGVLMATIPVIKFPPRVGPYLLPQIANGQSGALTAKTTFVLVNRGNAPASVVITLTNNDGSPFVVDIPNQGTGSTFHVELLPSSLRILQTDGSGTLASGAAVIHSDMPIGVSALFSVFSAGALVSEAGVLESAKLNSFTIPVDMTGGSNVGISLFNPGDSDAVLTLRLLDTTGRLVDSSLRVLPAKAHESKFVSELFAGVPADFTGAVSVSSTVPISSVALRVTGPLLATMPVIKGGFQ